MFPVQDGGQGGRVVTSSRRHLHLTGHPSLLPPLTQIKCFQIWIFVPASDISSEFVK